MKKVNFNLPVLGLDGQPMFNGATPILMDDVLANNLANAQTTDARKFNYWAKEVYNKQDLNLDPVDLEKIVDYVTKLPIASIIKVQILDILEA